MRDDVTDYNPGASWKSLVGWILLSLSAGFLGALVSQPGPWYDALRKPPGTPPGWVFGPVWTTLYILMGISTWLVWGRRQSRIVEARSAITLFLVQLVLNAAWSWLFFGLHRPDLAFVEIVVLWTFLLLTVVAFLRVRFLAGLLMLPYLAWVSYASYLNAAFWVMNPNTMG